MSDDAELIEVRREGPVAVVLLNRPAKLNALNPGMVGRLREVFAGLADDDGVRAVVLGGEGRAFAAGADISFYATATPARFAAFQRECGALCEAIESSPVPVVAAVRGLALGGGFELVLASDLVVAGAGASFGLPEARLGLLPGWGGTQRLTRLVGRNRAKHLIMTGERISAARAWELGIVNRVAEDDAVLGRAVETATALAESAPLAIRGIKQAVNEGAEAPLRAALAIEREILLRLFATDDARAGVDAFVAKRDPAFTGT